MISRVAESCFWIQRYVERAEHTARLLRETRAFLLDVQVPELEQWQPVIVVSGERERFAAFAGDPQLDESERVQNYLVWNEDSPIAIERSVFWARENARTIREVISGEMWEALNGLWHWLKRGQGKRVYSQDRDAFYGRIKDSAALFQGVCHSTMLHEEPFDFMRLGMLLERASQTARVLDVKYHALGPTVPAEGDEPTRKESPESPLESAEWTTLLRCCSAEQSYFRRHQLRQFSGMSGQEVAGFLLKEEAFPRSVFHCLSRAWNFLRRIETSTGRVGLPSALALEPLVKRLESNSIDDILREGLHGELTHIIDTVAGVCDRIHTDYFDPSLPS